MKKSMYISGTLKDMGIDGPVFRPDYLYICDSVSVANQCRDRRDSQVYKLVPVRKPAVCKLHPKYQLKRRPTSNCAACQAAWFRQVAAHEQAYTESISGEWA